MFDCHPEAGRRVPSAQTGRRSSFAPLSMTNGLRLCHLAIERPLREVIVDVGVAVDGFRAIHGVQAWGVGAEGVGLAYGPNIDLLTVVVTAARSPTTERGKVVGWLPGNLLLAQVARAANGQVEE